MALDILLFCAVIGVGAYAVRKRDGHILAERELDKERALSRTLGLMNGQLRSQLEAAQRRLVEVGGMGSPGLGRSGGCVLLMSGKEGHEMAIGQTRLERQARRTEKRATVGRGTRRNRKKSKHELKKEFKNARRAEWRSKVGTAANKKRKRDQTAQAGGHPCGNIGCWRCFPALAQRIRSNPHSCDRRRHQIVTVAQ